MAGATWNCCHLGAFCVHHTTMHLVTSCKATYVRCIQCLAVTCNLHFWQNDLGLLCATAVTQGWNGYPNKSQHRKLTLEKKIHPPLLQGFEPTTFWSWIRYSNQWAIPAPNFWIRQQFDCWPPRLSEFPLLNKFLYMYRLLTNTAKHGHVVWSVRFH